MPIPGYDVTIVDDPISGVSGNQPDTLFLLSQYGGDEPVAYTAPNSGNATLDAQLAAYFKDGTVQGRLVSAKSAIVQGIGSGYELPELEDALTMLPQGPGQVVAPEVVDEPEMLALAEGAWAQRKVALLNAPLGMTDEQCETLADALTHGGDCRGAGLWRDYGQHVQADGSTVTVPFTVTVAAMIAANDIVYGNPGLAAAGADGVSADVVSLSDPVTETRRQDLWGHHVNTAKIVSGAVRNYGFRTLANLDALPAWWDLSGSRVVAVLAAQMGAIDEQVVFGQLDSSLGLIGRYESLVRNECKTLKDIGALFDYDVLTDASVNPLSSLQQGQVSAQVTLSISPFAEHIVTTITRRLITVQIS